MAAIFEAFSIGVWIGLAIVAAGLIWLGVSLGSMQKKFVELGALKGLTMEEITDAVGKGPSHIQYVKDGSVAVWSAIGYQVTLLFNKKGVCQGVANESSI